MKNLLSGARTVAFAYLTYKAIDGVVKGIRESKNKEEMVITEDVEEKKIGKKEITKVAAGGAVASIVIAQYKTIRDIQKDIEKMKEIIYDLF